MAVYSENDIKLINSFHGQIAEHFGVQVLGFKQLQCVQCVSSYYKLCISWIISV